MNPTCLLSVTQKKGEKPRDFIQYFNTKRLKVEDCGGDVAMAAFTKGFNDKDHVKFLYLNPFKDFDEIMNRAKDHLIVNKALQFTDDNVPLPSFGKKAKKQNGAQNY